MPTILNVNNLYNSNNKRLSSKLTFQVGEKFSGRIVEVKENKEVLIKLTDGLQFQAEIEGEVPLDGFFKFQVQDFENGKLRLKILTNDLAGNAEEKNDVNIFVSKEGIVNSDLSILKDMLVYEMPLTKENINFVKGLFQFSDKINENGEEINKFVDKFLDSKVIEGEKVQEVKNILIENFNAFKTMSKEDILFFIENNIDITKENIESYNKLSSDNNFLGERLTEISLKLQELNIDTNKFEKIEESIALKEEKSLKENRGRALNNKQASQVYDYIKEKNKPSMLNILKSIMAKEENRISNLLRTVVTKNENLFSKEELKEIKEVLDNTNDKEFEKIFKDNFNNSNNITKEAVEEVLGKITGKDIIIGKNEYFSLIDIMALQEDKKIIEDNLTIENNMNNEEILVKNEIRNEIKSSIEETKDIVKNLLEYSKVKGEVSEKILQIFKNNINDIRLLNSINEQYYYLDIPLKREEREYPCKLIIKDNRKEGKRIDKNNVKMVLSIKTINLGTIDGYIKVRDKKMTVDLKIKEDYIKFMENKKEKLVDVLSTLGYFVQVDISKREEESTLFKSREFFNDNNILMIDRRV